MQEPVTEVVLKEKPETGHIKKENCLAQLQALLALNIHLSRTCNN